MDDENSSGGGYGHMSDLIANCRKLLRTAQIDLDVFEVRGREAAAIEGYAIVGFILIYRDASTLLQEWRRDMEELVTRNRQQLSSALSKTSNSYLLLFAETEPTYGERIGLAAIEEDLVGARKIVRAGVTVDNLQIALLPLLPLQNAPRLTAVDMRQEIKLRTTELRQELVDAFLIPKPIDDLAQLSEELE